MVNNSYLCGVVEGFYGRPWTTEQRKHLFSLLRKFGMNTYLYAPKDDLKHRAEWRLLYTPEETVLLESLIKTASENGITFVYALSPGIDIVYSNAKEVKAIQDKLNQVRSLGCTAFSLLFDDIETTMNELDRKQFSSFALAQLTVANSVYESLECPLFFFCPTEYCESSASPSLDESDYLTLLGNKLLPGIHILWTGPRVVSRLITVEHLRRVSAVLRRKPLIWDNLHANDYDPKRVFMGPFLGRSVAIKNETSGLLLNPNCKYEANYVPLFTLSDWVQSDMDAPKVEEDQDAVLESSVSEEAIKVVERSKSARLYHPITSLRRALADWLPQFRQGPGPAIPPLSQRETQSIATMIDPSTMSSSDVPPPQIRTCECNELLTDLPPPIYTSPIGNATTITVQAFPLSEAIIGVVEACDTSATSKEPPLTVNSLTVDYNEPMDIPISSSKEDVRMVSKISTTDLMEEDNLPSVSVLLGTPGIANILPKTVNGSISSFDLESIALFVDMFYLPFDYGKRGADLFNELKWLYENAQILRSEGPESKECEEWHRRFKAFRSTANQLTELYQNIIQSPNKSLLQEIFPYLWEAQGLLSVLCALLEWMRKGNLLISPSEYSSWIHPDEVYSDSEPWALGGGLLPDMQKLMIASPRVGEIFTVKYAIPLSLTCYAIRHVDLLDFDKSLLFQLFATSDEQSLAKSASCLNRKTSHSPEEFFFDITFALFLKYGAPSHHFVAECVYKDEAKNKPKNDLCSIAVGILNVSGLVDNFNSEFLAQFRSKYLIDGTLSSPQNEQQMEDDSHQENASSLALDEEIERRLTIPQHLSADFLTSYPSLVEIRWPTNVNEAVSVRRLLHCVSASLAINGSTGFFTVINADSQERIELLTRLGLRLLDHGDLGGLRGFIVMGHAL